MTFGKLVQSLIYIVLSVCNCCQGTNLLNGQHLRVLAMEYPVALTTIRNSTGHVVSFDGSLKQHLLAISEMFNFSYSFLPVIAPVMEDTPAAKGGLYYFINNMADLVLGTAIATTNRLKDADFPASWIEAEFYCIVPYPREKLNIAASLKPLSYEAWISIVVTGCVTIIFLRFSIKNKFQMSQTVSRNWKGDNWQVVHFVLRNLVSQGQVVYSNRLAFRIAAGAWCGACFFLVNIYCSTLTSHLTSPNQKPIANTVHDLAETPSLSFTVQRNYGLDVALQSAKSGNLKRLADSTNKNPKFRCNATVDCLEVVRGGYSGFGAAINNLKLIMDEDIKRTGTCHYYMLKDTFLRLSVFTPLRKNSPYTETISIGILRFQQTGLSEHWESWYVPTPWKCLEINRRDKLPRLSIGHLSSAFVILISGYILGFVALSFEKIKTNCGFAES